MFPWDDPNYGIDEQWAVFYPYGTTLEQQQSVELKVRITNHSPVKRTFKITPRTNGGTQLLDYDKTLTLEPRQTGEARVRVQASGKPGNYLVTADIQSSGMEFRDWIEALITVE